ncbi:MAG: Pol I core factor CF [Phylliscum demangeonii]|nr:MAG: Pol I core factor CF [Phylliscum demangeonii]
MHLASFYQKQFGCVFQAINTPLLLFKYIKDLGLPLYTLPAVKQIAEMLDYSFTFQGAPRIGRRLFSPETKLMSVLVIAVKVSHGPDDDNEGPCQPRTSTEPGSLVVDWDLWRARHGPVDATSTSRLARGEESLVREEHVFDMSSEQLDDYLDWYARTWIEDGATFLPEELLKLFPTGKPIQSAAKSMPRHASHDPTTVPGSVSPPRQAPIASVLRVREAVSNHGHLDAGKRQPTLPSRPGSRYQRYSAVKDIERHLRAFVEAAARLIGVTLETLVAAVRQAELKLIKYALERRLSMSDGSV